MNKCECWIVLAAIAMLAGCGSQAKVSASKSSTALDAAVVRVERKNLSSMLKIASEFEPYQEIDVYAKVSGYIKQLNINWGTHVRQDDLMAVLEIPELQQQLEVDQAAVHRSEQEIAGANEELSRAKSTYSVAHLTYSRLANVQKTRPELVAQEEIDVAQGKDQEASAGVSGAQDAVSAAQQGLAEAKAALEKDRAMYNYARITAPFDGVVTRMDAYTGSLLPAGTSSNKGDQALCRLSQNDLLRLVIPVPERAVEDIHVGEPVNVKVSATDRSFEGKIVRVSDQIDTDTRTMHTEIDVPNNSYALVPGMYATVELPLHTVHNAVSVPVQALQASSEDRGTVLVVNSNHTIERRDVTLGIQTATDAEITSGLEANEMVIFGDQSQYKLGESVVPKLVTPAATVQE